jgi:hypothetical protein
MRTPAAIAIALAAGACASAAPAAACRSSGQRLRLRLDNSVGQKSTKAGRCGKRTGCAAIGTEIPSWRSSNCPEMDEVEKAEGPRFLSVGPVPDSQSAIVQLGPEPKERDPAFRRRASVHGLQTLGLRGQL